MAGPVVGGGDSEEQEPAVFSGALLEACSVLHSAPPRLSIGKRHGKAALSDRSSEVQSSGFPALPGEPPAATELRSRAFLEVWSATEQRLQTALQGLNQSTLESIQRWIARENYDSKMGDLLAASGAPEEWQHAIGQRATGRPFATQLPAALLFVGGLNWADHSSTMANLAAHLRKCQCQVATLGPEDFRAGRSSSGSVAVKRMLRQLTGVEPETADLEVLAAWHEEKGDPDAHLVVLLEAVESCQLVSLAPFLLLLCEWRVRLPLVLVLGIGTSAGALGRILPSAAMSRLRTQRFELPPDQQRLDAAVGAALLAPASVLLPAPACTRFLLTLTHYHDTTLVALTRSLKMAVLDHFASQPLSGLCALVLDAPHKAALESGCRALPPWLLHQAAEQLTPGRPQAGAGGDLASQLARAICTLQAEQQQWRAAVVCLHDAAVEAGEVPAGGLCGTLVAAAAHQQGRSAAGDPPHLASACAKAIRSMKAEPMAALLERWGQRCELSPPLLAKVKAVHQSMEARHGGEGAEPADPESANAGSTEGGKGTNAAATGGTSRESRTSRAQMGLSADMRRRSMLLRAGPAPSLPPSLADRVVELLHSLARVAARAWDGAGIESAFALSFPPQLQQAAVAPQRTALAGSLLAPKEALHCACCGTGEGGAASLPDTCLAYALCRQQPPEGANIGQWFSAFAAEQSRPSAAHQSPKKRKRAATKGRRGATEKMPLSGDSSAAVQGRFVQAAAELQLLGLLQPSKRRPQHVQYILLDS